MSISSAAADLYSNDASAATFGIGLTAAGDNSATVTMTVRADMCNGFGILHGGMTFLLADSAMAFASNADGPVALASSAEVDWLAPISVGDELTAVAEQRWTSGRSSLWDVTVSRAVDGGFQTVAMVRGRTRQTGRAPAVG